MSPKSTSDPFPSDINDEKPIFLLTAQSKIAAVIAPDCETRAMPSGDAKLLSNLVQ